MGKKPSFIYIFFSKLFQLRKKQISEFFLCTKKKNLLLASSSNLSSFLFFPSWWSGRRGFLRQPPMNERSISTGCLMKTRCVLLLSWTPPLQCLYCALKKYKTQDMLLFLSGTHCSTSTSTSLFPLSPSKAFAICKLCLSLLFLREGGGRILASVHIWSSDSSSSSSSIGQLASLFFRLLHHPCLQEVWCQFYCTYREDFPQAFSRVGMRHDMKGDYDVKLPCQKKKKKGLKREKI